MPKPAKNSTSAISAERFERTRARLLQQQETSRGEAVQNHGRCGAAALNVKDESRNHQAGDGAAQIAGLVEIEGR